MTDETLEAADAPAPEAAAEREPLDLNLVKRVLEAALLSASEPLALPQLKRLFGGELDVESLRRILDELKEEWAERAVELTAVASGWRFRVRPDYQKYLDRISSEKAPRYSRAVLETLAIIAYRQPATRGDIEDIRGVAVSPPTLKALEERGWIDVVGHRETPGRPALFATTRKFLDDLNLRSLEELPALEELQSTLDATLGSAPFPAQEPLLGAPDEGSGESSPAHQAGPAEAPTPREAPGANAAPTPIPEDIPTGEAEAAAPSQDTEQEDHAR
jgi:segregation and condensation protein B